MPDVEKVIKAISCLLSNCSCTECEYHEAGSCVDAVLSDALELLKEKELKDKMFHALEEDWKKLKGMTQIVRCKDCTFYENGGCGNTDSDSPCKNLLDVKPDWFCADGERKEGR